MVHGLGIVVVALLVIVAAEAVVAVCGRGS